MENPELIYRSHTCSHAKNQYHCQPCQPNQHNGKKRLPDLPGKQSQKTSFCHKNMPEPRAGAKQHRRILYLAKISRVFCKTINHRDGLLFNFKKRKVITGTLIFYSVRLFTEN